MTFCNDRQTQNTITTLSVRSAFDLYLQARNFPKGSEIIMTAVNIPDMCQIAKEHGLVAVPLDIDIYTMQPVSVDAFKALITEKTKCVLFAYLYGIIYDIKPYLEVIKDSTIEVLEDVA